MDALRHRLARQYGESLLAEVTAEGPLRPRRDASGVLALALALAVHGVTAALLVGGLLLVTLGWGSGLPFLGALCLVTAWVLRPRFARLPEDEPVLRRADAPELFALIDEIAGTVGTTGVHAVSVTGEFNASVSTYGLRRRRVLSIGLGLWETLGAEQRIALLGHELGHYANGDTRHGLIIGNACRSLDTWRYLLAPAEHPTPLEAVINALYLLPRSAVTGVLMVLDHLTLRAAQRGEYLADSFAARCGSTEAAVGLMDRLLVADSVAAKLLRESNSLRTRRGGTAAGGEVWSGLWERLAAHMDTIPESEHERQRRCSALRGHSVDATHPPTHLRRTRLLTAAVLPAAVTMDTARRTALQDELSGARDRVARRIMNGR
ncbi:MULTISPECIES: M48 family metallopeptidase [unclassified Streptomyces]|uniref:M48 family metallopeptidase n=1 Tax=unclassified Streptomyces TaxID=2593676 RepID=UPI002254EFF0|nr:MULTISPECIES: M48 family metallopeptidase [unclassified Streptomyces]MCX5142423.1 M48 family metallopeptidase [Streptomyces sp. NBC_00338]WSU60881.1 M48 family metallopeptidase [Streptomyces sp. NBC_01104]